jgi:hypothetical protein
MGGRLCRRARETVIRQNPILSHFRAPARVKAAQHEDVVDQVIN